MTFSYMYLGVTLTRLQDDENACAAYEKAISMDAQEPVFHLNYGRLDTMYVGNYSMCMRPPLFVNQANTFVLVVHFTQLCSRLRLLDDT